MDSLSSFWDAVSAFWSGLTAVAFQALLVGLALNLANLVLRSYAWRNILQAAHPFTRVRWRSVLGAYLAGVGINSVLPARGGDVMKAYLVHRSVPGASYPAIASSLLAETALDTVIGSTLLIWAYSTGALPRIPELPHLSAFEWSFFAAHGRFFLLLLAALLIAVGVFFTWIEHHVTSFWARVGAGLAILREPRRYLRQVVAFQALGWICRAGAMYAFLEAFHIHASVRNALLALVAGSAATLLPLTPGGAGTQQAVLVYMFRGVAGSAAVLSYSVGAQLAVTVANALAAAVALSLMLRRLPWKARVGTDTPPLAAKP